VKLDPHLAAIAADQPYPLVFMTVSGAHLYGFPSPDSDYDLRGVHILPAEKMLGLAVTDETLEKCRIVDGLEIDSVTHDLLKFLLMVLKRNGYVLEQLYSPLVVTTTPEHAELKAIATQCITKHHSHHYLGFAENQWRLFSKETPRRVKPLLYVYRVLLTGIHLMRTGEILANLPELNAAAHLPYIPELIARKLAGPEQSTLNDADVEFHQREYERLCAELEAARDASILPEMPSTEARAALNDLLIRVRLHKDRDEAKESLP
jgi:predicted nucleotidyltransferase